MTSSHCKALKSQCLEQAHEARRQKNAAWEQAQMNRLHKLGDIEERILTREAAEQAKAAK